MLRSLIVCSLMLTGSFVFDTAEAEAHRRWVRRPIARAVFGPRIVHRPWRYHRPYHYGPRVSVNVGYGGYYGW